MTTFGLVLFFLGMDLGGQGRDIDRRVGQRAEHAADIVRRDGRKIALQIDDDFGLAAGVELAQRLESPVRAGGVVGARHDRFAAMGCHGGCDLRRVGGDGDAADFGGLGPAQHMDDHRQAGDVQQRLAGQAGRGHAGGNQHQSAGFGHRGEVWTRLKTSGKMMGIGRTPAHLYGLPERGQTDISSQTSGAVRKPDS